MIEEMGFQTDREKKKQYENFKNSRFYHYFENLLEMKKIFEQHCVKFIFVQTPVAERIKNLSEFERTRLQEWQFDFNRITEDDIKKIRQIYGEEVKVEYLKSLYEGANVYEENGVKKLLDYRSPYVNVLDGHRITCYQPQEEDNCIYMFGQCTMRGTGVEDKQTIASFLQLLLNDYKPRRYKVENYAIGCGSDLHDDLSAVKKLKYKAGDIVILCSNLQIVPTELFELNEICYYDTSSIFHRPHHIGEWFTDMTFHTNARGNEEISKFIFHILGNGFLFTNEICEPDELCFEQEQVIIPEGIKTYLNKLKKEKVECSRSGAIVMNCNPFTLGHQFLIETAASQVEYLYVFVVEEDKSFFRFQDRFRLVTEGTKHIKNVKVLPSGEYMISLSTFPGYFNKDNIDCTTVDATQDLEIFCRYIAPCLNIRCRFVGSEPVDMVTNGYNLQMKKILKKYDLECIEIERIQESDKVISASTVRNLLKEKNWKEIEKIVPKSTLLFLRENYDSAN